MRRHLCWGACLAVVLVLICGTVLLAAEDTGPAVATDQKQVDAEAPAAPAPPESAAAARTAKETPEIEVEVVGKKVGAQPLPSFAPTTGEVVTSINSAELEATGETNLADALEFLPGVTVTHQGRRSEMSVQVRGGSSPVYLLDGALISSGIFATRFVYTLPLSAIERVDVIRSSSGLIYGPQALTGGAVNIVTKSGKGKGKGEASVFCEGGSFDYIRGGISVGQGPVDKGLFLAADYDTSNSNLEFGEHRLQRVFLKSDQDMKGGATVKFSLVSVDGQRNFDVWDAEWQAFAKTNPAYWGIDPYREKLLTLAYSRPFAKTNSVLDLELWYRNQFYHNFSFGGPIRPKAGQNVYFDESGNIYGGDVMLRLQPAQNHYVRLGMQTWKFDGYTQNFTLQKDGTIAPQPQAPYWTSAGGSNPAQSKLTSYFAQDEWSVTPRTRFFYGGRYQIPGLGLHEMFTYALGLEHEWSERVDLYAHYGTGVDYPTPSALASNPLLKDRTSDNIDVGIEKHFSPNLMGRVGWFQSAISNDFISYLKDGGNPSTSADYVQVQADFTKSGLEAELKGAVPSVRSLSYFANYTYLHQEVTRVPMAEGRPLQLAVPPKGQFSLGLRWAPDRRTRLALSYTSMGDRIARSGYYSMAYSLPAYSYANLTASRQLGAGWSLNAALNNMFDAAYESQPGFPRPGRNFTFGFSHTSSIK